MSKIISEINRVSKSFYHDVPAINTFVESHTNLFYDHNNNKSTRGIFAIIAKEEKYERRYLVKLFKEEA